MGMLSVSLRLTHGATSGTYHSKTKYPLVHLKGVWNCVPSSSLIDDPGFRQL